MIKAARWCRGLRLVLAWPCGSPGLSLCVQHLRGLGQEAGFGLCMGKHHLLSPLCCLRRWQQEHTKLSQQMENKREFGQESDAPCAQNKPSPGD